MVTGSGPVVQAVLYLLVFFSVASWGIILYKARQIRAARRASERFIEMLLGDEEPDHDPRRQPGDGGRARSRRCSAPATRSWCG